MPVILQMNKPGLFCWWNHLYSLQWRHNEWDFVSNHQPHDCLLNRLFRCRSKKTSKLRITGLCEGNSPVTGEFPAQMARNAENVSIWWPYHAETTLSLRLKQQDDFFLFYLIFYIIPFLSMYYFCMKQAQYKEYLVSIVDTDGLVF